MQNDNLINGHPASAYQIAIRDFVKASNGHAVIAATAGSGKTTSLEWCMSSVPDSRVLYLAFNRDIVGAFRKRQNGKLSNVKASTAHSWGLENLRRANYRLQVDADGAKSWKIVQELLPSASGKRTTPQNVLVELLRMSRLTLTDPNDAQALNLMSDQFGYDFEGLSDAEILALYEILPIALKRGNDLFWNEGLCDFEDMLYLAGKDEVKIQPNDFIFYDELQDANEAQIKLLLKSLGASGRAVCVGDRWQGIYSFAGATPDAVDKVKTALDAVELPLSISYRCPRRVVEEARKICPFIEAAPNAKDGEVLSAHEVKLDDLIRPEKDVILCRQNAPLVGKALDFIASGRKACLRGRDIGKNLAGFARKLAKDGHTLLDFHAKLDAWESTELARLMARYASEQRLDLVRDKAGVVRQIASRVQTPDEVAIEIEKIFRDQPDGIQLSSIHRAKGLEFESVYILRPELLPSKAPANGKMSQERNVKFVAVTRSKDKLYFLDGKAEEKKVAQVPVEEIKEEPKSSGITEEPAKSKTKKLRGESKKLYRTIGTLDELIEKGELDKAHELCKTIRSDYEF